MRQRQLVSYPAHLSVNPQLSLSSLHGLWWPPASSITVEGEHFTVLA